MKWVFPIIVHQEEDTISQYSTQEGEIISQQSTGGRREYFPPYTTEEIISKHNTPGRRIISQHYIPGRKDYFPAYTTKKRLFPSIHHKEEIIIIISQQYTQGRRDYFPEKCRKGVFPSSVHPEGRNISLYSTPGKRESLQAQYTRNPLQNFPLSGLGGNFPV
jgi:hypothetical protein